MNKLMSGVVFALSIFTTMGVYASNFDGNWKSVSKANGNPLPKKVVNTLSISCKGANCFVTSETKSFLSDKPMVDKTEWSLKDSDTLSLHDVAFINAKDGKLISDKYIYVKQSE